MASKKVIEVPVSEVGKMEKSGTIEPGDSRLADQAALSVLQPLCPFSTILFIRKDTSVPQGRGHTGPGLLGRHTMSHTFDHVTTTCPFVLLISDYSTTSYLKKKKIRTISFSFIMRKYIYTHQQGENSSNMIKVT